MSKNAASKCTIKGFKEFCNYFKRDFCGQKIYVLFVGSRLENGESWCPDTNKGDK